MGWLSPFLWEETHEWDIMRHNPPIQQIDDDDNNGDDDDVHYQHDDDDGGGGGCDDNNDDNDVNNNEWWFWWWWWEWVALLIKIIMGWYSPFLWHETCEWRAMPTVSCYTTATQ